MSAPTLVQYNGNGRNFVWVVPFPFGSPDDVCVSIKDESGMERRLASGTDYQIQGQNVFCIVPKGKSIIVWLAANVEEA